MADRDKDGRTWEYKSIESNLSLTGAKEDYEARLAEAGKKGWELVAVHPTNYSITAYLKRQLT